MVGEPPLTRTFTAGPDRFQKLEFSPIEKEMFTDTFFFLGFCQTDGFFFFDAGVTATTTRKGRVGEHYFLEPIVELENSKSPNFYFFC